METVYEVKRILNCRQLSGVKQYLIEWKGYPKDQATWEPLENLTDVQSMIDKYDMKHRYMKDNPNVEEEDSPEDSQDQSEQEEEESEEQVMELRRSTRKRAAPCYRQLEEEDFPIRSSPFPLPKIVPITVTPSPLPERYPSSSSESDSSIAPSSQTKEASGNTANNPTIKSKSSEDSDLNKYKINRSSNSSDGSSIRSNQSEEISNGSDRSNHSDGSNERSTDSEENRVSADQHAYYVLPAQLPSPPCPVQVIDAKKTQEGDVFFKVKREDDITEMTHQQVRSAYPVALCLFFEKEVRFTKID